MYMYNSKVNVVQYNKSHTVPSDFYYTVDKTHNYTCTCTCSMRNPCVYAIYMATRPRACACIFHKTLGLMLYLLLISRCQVKGCNKNHTVQSVLCNIIDIA